MKIIELVKELEKELKKLDDETLSKLNDIISNEHNKRLHKGIKKSLSKLRNLRI